MVYGISSLILKIRGRKRTIEKFSLDVIANSVGVDALSAWKIPTNTYTITNRQSNENLVGRIINLTRKKLSTATPDIFVDLQMDGSNGPSRF